VDDPPRRRRRATASSIASSSVSPIWASPDGPRLLAKSTRAVSSHQPRGPSSSRASNCSACVTAALRSRCCYPPRSAPRVPGGMLLWRARTDSNPRPSDPKPQAQGPNILWISGVKGTECTFVCNNGHPPHPITRSMPAASSRLRPSTWCP